MRFEMKNDQFLKSIDKKAKLHDLQDIHFFYFISHCLKQLLYR